MHKHGELRAGLLAATLGFLAVAVYAQGQSDAPARAQGQAAQKFYQGKADGWYWYKDPKEAPKPVLAPNRAPQAEAAPKIKNAPSKDAESEPFSVRWLQINMPKLHEEAINNPTHENVEAYYYAQRIAMDKSQRYANMAQQVVATDPFLDENNRVPMSTFANPMFLKQVMDDKSEALKHLAKVGGLWVFFDSTCGFCKPQVFSVNELAKQYGFYTKFISMDGKGIDEVKTFVKDSGQAKRLDLKITPTTVLVVPPNNFYVVSQGLMAQGQLAERLVIVADAQKLFPDEISKKLHVYDRGILTTEDMADGAGDDPKSWVRLLKDRLHGRY